MNAIRRKTILAVLAGCLTALLAGDPASAENFEPQPRPSDAKTQLDQSSSYGEGKNQSAGLDDRPDSPPPVKEFEEVDIINTESDQENHNPDGHWQISAPPSSTLEGKIANIISMVAVLLLCGTLVVTRNTARRQLRAYVCVLSAVREPADDGGAFEKVTMNIKNAGQTPAYRAVVRHALVWAADEKSVVFEEENLKRSEVATLGPYLPQGIVELIPHSNPEFRAFARGNGCYLLFGVIEYKDAFGTPRKTWFRLVDTHISVASFGYSRQGNDAN